MSLGPEEPEVKLSKDQEKAITELFGAKFLELSKDEHASLSKVLFPDTHTVDVEVLGVKRKLRPLPLKLSKQLFEILRPVSAKIQGNANTLENVDMSAKIIDVLKEVASLLAPYYAWDDVPAAIKDDGLSLAELQAISVLQTKINGANDFLLAPLRIIVRVMQIHEVAMLKFNTMFSSRVSPESGIAL